MPFTPEIFRLRYSRAFVATASHTKLERRECSNSSCSPSTASTLSRSLAKVRTRIKTSKSPVELLDDAEEINHKERNSYIAFPPTWDHEIWIQEQEQMLGDQSKIIDRMQNEEKLLHGQDWRVSDQPSQAKGGADNLKTQITTLEEQARSMSLKDQVASINMNDMKGACNKKDQELSERSNIIQVLSDHNQQLQRRVAHLERIFASTSQQGGTNLQSFLDRYTEMEATHNDLTTRINMESLVKIKLQQTVQTMESNNASLKNVIEVLTDDASALETCQPQTLRSLLTMRLVEQALTPATTTTTDGDISDSWWPIGLSPTSLDSKRSSAEIRHLADILPTGPGCNSFYKRLSLKSCSVCSKRKFRLKDEPGTNLPSTEWLSEFLGMTSGSGDLSGTKLRHRGSGTFEDLREALAFRQAPEELNPRPNDETLQKAAELTRNLVEAGRMYSVFDLKFD
ncbi:hypothetical protein LZ554_003434 [Drepanopeziza brunnea f. sp. 'monogermtubi']|nr:hypothetical protein LZ554_003434 [Drepanopeziza brunnea f. sp. 'monogermtubi']